MTTEARIILTAQDRTAQAFRSAQAQLAQMNVAVGKVNSALGALGIGVSIGAVTAALTQSARAAINFGDEMQKASARTGVSASRFAVLADAAKMADVDVSALSVAFKKMQVAVSQAGSGAKGPLEAFKALGIQFEQFRQLDPEQQFLELAQQISELKDPADRVRASVELFGKSGADLLPFFEQGAAGIRQATDAIREMGGALTDEQIRQLAEADDAIKKLDQSWNTLARTLTAAVAPALVAVLDRTSSILQQRGGIEELAKAWAKLAATPIALPGIIGNAIAGDSVTQRFSTGTRLPPGGRSRTPSRSAPGYLPSDPKGPKGRTPTPAELAGLSEIAITARQISTGAYQQMLDDMNDATKTSIEKQLDQWRDLQAQLDEVFAEGMISPEVYNARIQEMNDQFLEPITITAEKIFPKEEREQLSEFWMQASRNTQDILSEYLFQGWQDGIDGLLNSFVTMLQRMAAEAVAAQIAQKLFGTGGMGSGSGLLGQLASLGMSYFGGGGAGSGLSEIAITAQKIPGYAKGGYIAPGSLGWTGENGPELIYGGKSGVTVTPMQSGGPINVTNHFAINAPGGRVGPRTEAQIAASVARGMAMANRRMN